MWCETILTERLSIKYPIIQAGMAGSTTPELVAAVSNAGGLGTIGAGYMTPEILKEEIIAVRALTQRPFAVNLFVPETVHYDTEHIKNMQMQLKPYYDKYNLEVSKVNEHPESIFKDKLQLLVNMHVPVISFTFGVPDRDTVQELKAKGIITIATAGSVDEAKVIEQLGFDMVVAQGHEAGGHKGSYTNARGIGSMALIPQVADSVSIPVIAAGGIMDERGILASLTLGASGVQMGTAFLTTSESKAPDIHKDAIMQALPSDTVVTKVISGKRARGIENELIRTLENSKVPPLPYPLQNDLTSSIRKSAVNNNDTKNLHMWCGQAPLLAKRTDVNTLVQEIACRIDHLILNIAKK